MPLLFVYGTLQRGCRNHHQLAGQRFVTNVRTPAGWTLYALGRFPGLIADPQDRQGVPGELWEVSAAVLAHLDRVEGVPEGLFTRQTIALAGPGPIRAEAYLYALGTTGRQPLPHGWQEERARRPATSTEP